MSQLSVSAVLHSITLPRPVPFEFSGHGREVVSAKQVQMQQLQGSILQRGSRLLYPSSARHPLPRACGAVQQAAGSGGTSICYTSSNSRSSPVCRKYFFFFIVQLLNSYKTWYPDKQGHEVKRPQTAVLSSPAVCK